MLDNRDQVRQVFLDVWAGMQQQRLLEPLQTIIAGVIEQHPEYHSLLERGADAKQQAFAPDRENPFLHMGMHITLREQTASDRPAGIKSLHAGLVAARGQHAAEHAMMECLGAVLWRAQRAGLPADEAAYLDCLRKL